jgi:hypothetical protein
MAKPFNKLIVVEGPFDAMRLDYYGSAFGIRSTCLFGKRLDDAQVALLDRIPFNDLYICLDPGVEFDSLRMVQKLAHLNAKFTVLPGNVDGADLPIKSLMKFFNDILQ